jgi:NAD(P)H dehydrogenase (quinone)
MPTNVLVTFYSTYGHVHRMARAVAEGAESVPDTTVRLCRIAEPSRHRPTFLRSRTTICAGPMASPGGRMQPDAAVSSRPDAEVAHFDEGQQARERRFLDYRAD